MSLKEIRSLKPDIIYSRSTPISSAILAYKLKKRLKLPWVMHLSDPWVGNPYYNWSIASKKKCAHFERLLFDSADIITLTSETAVKLYIEKYPHRKHDILYFPNVYDEINKKSLEIDIDKKIRITYTGNIYKQRGIYPLIQAVEYIKSNHPDYTNALEVKIAGNIDDENLNLLERSDHKIITYLGHLNYSDSTDLINSSHILVTIDKPLENEFDNTFLPSKIMDYLASNRIILGITHKGSPTYKQVHNRFGKCFLHSEVSQISKFIIDVINSYRKNLMTNFKPEKEIDFFSAEYQSKILKKTFEKLIT